MAYGLIRVRRISMDDISSTEKHNFRLYENENDMPKNINKTDSDFGFTGSYVYLGNEEREPEKGSLKKVIEDKIKLENVKGIRKNSSVALEYSLGINDMKVWENYSPKGFFANATKWIEERHGKGSVVAVSHHFDESNPHAHIIVVPTKEKEVKWKNKNGKGVRTEVRLNTREFTSQKKDLSKLQDDYHKFVKGFEMKMGVEFYRGTKAEHQLKIYSDLTDHKLGELRAKRSDLSNDKQNLIDRLREIRLLDIQLLNKNREKSLADKKRKSKTNWKLKGNNRWNPFH
jgi:hypothetical protein